MSLLVKTKKLLRLLMNAGYRAGLMKGAAAGIEHEQVLRTIVCDVVLDVGANKGQFTLVTRKIMPNAKIIAFEPMAHAAAVFARVHASDRNIRLVHGAVGAKDEQVSMYISAREDSSSLLPITPLQNEIFPGTESVGEEVVVVKTLSHWISPQELTGKTLLKIDVQGFELEVLRGTVDMLGNIHYVYVECSFIELYDGQALAWEVNEFLSSHGFHIAGLYNVNYDSAGVAVQADFLYCRAH